MIQVSGGALFLKGLGSDCLNIVHGRWMLPSTKADLPHPVFRELRSVHLGILLLFMRDLSLVTSLAFDLLQVGLAHHGFGILRGVPNQPCTAWI